MARSPRDENHIPAIQGEDSVSGLAGSLIKDATTHGLYVHVVGSEVDSGGGTQYTEGDTDTSITGTAMLMEVAADALEPVQGTVADGMLVNLGSNNDVTLTNSSLNGPGAPTIDSYTHAAINLAAGANQVLVSSAANKQIWVYGITFTTNAAGTVSFQDQDDTAITGIMPFAANSGMAIPPSGNFSMPIWKLATDKDLEVDIVTSEVDGWIDYAIVSVS